MELSFWKSKWNKGETGFHMQEVYLPLKQYISHFNLSDLSTICVPLCGKSLDVLWLSEQQNYQIIAAEISGIAVNQMMKTSPYSFNKLQKGPFTVYKHDRLQIWEGDFMKLHPKWIPEIDLIYDKAALIALPSYQRTDYVRQIKSLIKRKGQIFQQTFEYNQSEMDGPPFSVPQKELQKLYGTAFDIELLYEKSANQLLQRFGKRGLQSYLKEKIYRLTPKT